MFVEYLKSKISREFRSQDRDDALMLLLTYHVLQSTNIKAV